MDLTILVMTGIIFMIYSTQHTTYARKQAGLRWWSLAYSVEQPKPSLETNEMAQLSDSIILNQMNSASQPLTKKQRKLVTNNPGSILAVGKGALTAINECKYQFQNRRWNCATNQTKNDVSIFGNILNIGCRETAFIYAITAAGVAHSISRACTEGKIYTCTCDYRKNEPSGENWKWGGCSDNVNFGYQFSKQFVDSIERGEDLRFMVNKQNNEAGRRHVQSVMSQQCKCHGMSGSCTMKTCWMRLPPFREVGNLLKEKFDGASMVYAGNSLGGNRPLSRSDPNRASRSSNRILSNSVSSNKSRDRVRKKGTTEKSIKGGSNKYNFMPVDSSHKIPTRKDMVYFEESPEFCGKDPGLEFKGTSNRECNATSLGIDGCELMCCDNGYRTENYIAREHCRCVFKWCCEVECDVCEFQRTRHICN